MALPDCGDNPCRYKGRGHGGMRTNAGCRCDDCPACGAAIRHPRTHREWCTQRDWTPPHQRASETKEGT